MKQNNIIKIFLIIAAITLFSSSVLAFAVSTKYYGDNPLYLQPGQTIDAKFVLQNHAGTEDVTVQAGITEGAEIIKLTGSSDIYLIPRGGRIDVNYQVTAPSGARVGDKYAISVEFSSTGSSEEAIAFSSSIGTGFDVFIGALVDYVEEEPEVELSPESKVSSTLYLIIGIIILIIIILIVLKKRNKKKGNRKKK